jgi:deoxyribodipyrimidine photo-lyase
LGTGDHLQTMEGRVRALNSHPVSPSGRYVLYWAQMNRRAGSNHALAHAAAMANDLKLPVLYYEGLTCTYPYANDRFHTFLLEGVPDTQKQLGELGIGYVFYLHKRRGDANDIVYRLAKDAAAVVTDDYPTFIARRHNAGVPGRIGAPYIVVDSSCVVPMSRIPSREYAAYTIRPKIHRLLSHYLRPAPEVTVKRKWDGPAPEFHVPVEPGNISALVAECEIDHTVAPSIGFAGGREAALRTLRLFLDRKLRRYARERNEPSAHATSDISPYLHFGHLGALETALAARRHAQEHQLICEEFLEELIVRRELAFNFARFSEDPEALENLPNWALETLRKHDGDKRDFVYTREQFEFAQTHDTLWNAAQKELLLRGKIHGYYRMYWGKKIIEWSASHREALVTMIYLHDRYALDGRDPNTYTNILWCFGLHDRPWAERPVFGMIRFMSYDGMKRKTDVEAYLREIEYLERTGKDPFRLQ